MFEGFKVMSASRPIVRPMTDPREITASSGHETFSVNVVPVAAIKNTDLHTLLAMYRDGQIEPLVLGESEQPEAAVIPFAAFQRLLAYDARAEHEEYAELARRVERASAPESLSQSLDGVFEDLGISEHARRMLDVLDEEVDPSSVDVDLRIARETDDEYGVLRDFSAEITCIFENSDIPVDIGRVTGWITFDVGSPDLLRAGDAIAADAMVLAEAVAQISREQSVYSLGILIDRIWIKEPWRGNRLTGVVVDQLLDLLQHDPVESVVVLVPEPLDEASHAPYPDGPVRDAALDQLQAAYTQANFEQWQDSTVWWRCPNVN